MLKNLLLFWSFLFALASSFADETKLIIYPVPESEKAISQYAVSVNGKPVDLYRAHSPQIHEMFGAEYYFCYFDFEGEVEVKIKSQNGFGISASHTVTDPAEREKLANTVIAEVLPDSIRAKKSAEEISFKQNKPFQAVVLRNKLIMPLIIFGNPIEKDAPNPKDENTIYFGPGVHYLKEPICLKDNQTLYIAGGAVIKSLLPDEFPLEAWNRGDMFYEIGNNDLKSACPNFYPICAWNAKNISIRGRGVISYDNRGRFRNYGVLINNCQNAKLDGVIIKDSNNWTLDIRNCNNVDVNNIKICGSRMINDDAIDICNSSNITIKNTFARAQDDIIAIKGIPGSGKHIGRNLTEDPMDKANNLPVENILIEDCIFWTDAANIFRIGYECDAPYFKNIKIKNILIPSYGKYFKPEAYWSNAIVWLQPSQDMKISGVEIDGLQIRSNGKDFPLAIANPRIVHCSKTPGFIDGFKMKNVSVYGERGKFRGEVWIEGFDNKYGVKNIEISSVRYFGKKQESNSKDVHIGNFTENVEVFKN